MTELIKRNLQTTGVFFKSILIAAFVLSACSNICADENKPSGRQEIEDLYSYAFSAPWTPIQLSCTPFSLFCNRADVYGINIGLLLGTFPNNVYGISYVGLVNMVWKNHCGISLSGIYMVMGKNYGISIAPINMVDENNALMLGVCNFGSITDTTGNGVQIGLVNHAESGFQIGLINYNKNAYIPWMPLFNFSFKREEK